MNKTKNESIAYKVLRRIEKKGGDTLWTLHDFSGFPPIPVAATLSRLSKKGKLERLRRGVYYFPKITSFGKSRPDPEKVTETMLGLSGTRAIKSGPSQFGRLGLTTQMSGALTMTVDRRVAKGSVQGIPLHVRARRLSEQKGITAEERTVLDALRDIHRIPDATPSEVLNRLKIMMEQKKIDYRRLARFALAEPPRVRALLGALGETLARTGTSHEKSVKSLRENLNGLSRYRISGVANALPNAKEWGIE